MDNRNELSSATKATSPVTTAIIPVGGLGTRFYPATKAVPKEMLPLVDKPIAQWLVEEAVASGITRIIFVTGQHDDTIRYHFGRARETEKALLSQGKKDAARHLRAIAELADFHFVEQRLPNGPGDALLCAKKYVGKDPVAVLYNDEIVMGREPCLRQLLQVFERRNAPVLALMRIPRKQAHRYGMVRAHRVAPRTWRIGGIVEKPSPGEEPSTLMSIGKYVYTSVLYNMLSDMKPGPSGELWPTSIIDRYIKDGGLVYGYEFEGVRFDCGDKLGFMQAGVYAGLRHPEIARSFRKYLHRKQW